MYRMVVKKITERLGPFARFLLGDFSAIFGIMMIVMATDSRDPFWAFVIGIFCFAVTFACITWGRVRQFAGSLMGTALFCMSLAYLWSEITGCQLLSVQNEPSALNAILFLMFMGIPGIAYAVRTGFGLRKKQL